MISSTSISSGKDCSNGSFLSALAAGELILRISKFRPAAFAGATSTAASSGVCADSTLKSRSRFGLVSSAVTFASAAGASAMEKSKLNSGFSVTAAGSMLAAFSVSAGALVAVFKLKEKSRG